MCPLGRTYLISQMRKQLPLKRSSPVQGPSVMLEPVGSDTALSRTPTARGGLWGKWL